MEWMTSSSVAELPVRLRGMLESHYRAGVVAKVEFLLVCEHRIHFAARHSAQMRAPTGARIMAEDLQRHRGAAIHTVVRAHADHENIITGAFILEAALDGLARSRILQ